MPHHNKKHCDSEKKCEAVPPWSETNWEPDAQWCPSVYGQIPLKVVQVPFYQSEENPTPQWAPNILLQPSCRCCQKEHHKHHKKHHHKNHHKCHFKDDIERYVYTRNPCANTVNAGGSHWQ